MAFCVKFMATTVIALGLASFILGVIAENKKVFFLAWIALRFLVMMIVMVLWT